MAIVKQGGSDPRAGQVMTTMGYRSPRPPLCKQCGERREDQLYTQNVYGQDVCADCAGTRGEGVLRATHDAPEFVRASDRDADSDR